MACGGVRANEVFLLYLFKALFIAWTYPLAPSSYHVVQNKNIKHSTEGWSRTQNKSSSLKTNAHFDHKGKEIELFFSQWLVFRIAFLSKARCYKVYEAVRRRTRMTINNEMKWWVLECLFCYGIMQCMHCKEWLKLLGLGLIKINTVLANFNNSRPSLISNS